MIRPLPCFALLSLCVFGLSAFADEKEEGDKKPDTEKKEDAKPGDKKPEEKPKDEKAKEDKPKESKGSVTIAGQEVKYVAKAGLLPLLKEDGSGERARVFYVYYAAVGADGKPLATADAAKRPITFCFNGGPGSSAVWLHFGGLGPAQGGARSPRPPVCAARPQWWPIRIRSSMSPISSSSIPSARARAGRPRAKRASNSGA
ncbi:MAG: hypothetical protein WDN28_09710 [Chthoniobacter sp.]